MNNIYNTSTLTDSSSMGTGEAFATLIMLLTKSVIIFTLITLLVTYIFNAITLWQIFKKANIKSWNALIPIYNTVLLYKLSGTSPWLISVYLLTLIPLGIIPILIVHAYFCNNLSKSFGKDIGYTIGLFIPPTSWIFYLILAFSKTANYVGPVVKSTNTTN